MPARGSGTPPTLTPAELRRLQAEVQSARERTNEAERRSRETDQARIDAEARAREAEESCQLAEAQAHERLRGRAEEKLRAAAASLKRQAETQVARPR